MSINRIGLTLLSTLLLIILSFGAFAAEGPEVRSSTPVFEVPATLGHPGHDQDLGLDDQARISPGTPHGEDESQADPASNESSTLYPGLESLELAPQIFLAELR